jgi:DNA-binding transcriptional LysR family regulator
MISPLTIRDTNDVDTNLLRTFVAVARCGSFSAAARDLGYTQSAVSQQVAALEHDLGVALLHRRPVAPTEAGQRLLEHAAPILLRLGAARADVQRLSGAPPTRLLVGVSPLVDTQPITAALVELQQSMPRVSLTLQVTDRDTVTSAIAEGAIDLGLVDGVTAASDPLHLRDAGPLTTTAVAERPVVIAMPNAHPLATRKRVSLDDLVDARWIDAPDTATPLTHLRAIAGADGFRASLRYDGTDVRTLLTLVAAGGGLALLPQHVVGNRPDATAIPLSAPRLVHRTELVHGHLTGPATELAATLKQR